MLSPEVANVATIPIDKIRVLNPRSRNRRVFREVIESIAAVGLKRPITVARRDRPEGTEYDLVCGQGRLEACQSLGQTTIPALVVEADDQQCMVMSLVENLARRQHRAIDLLRDIQGMKHRGYSETAIAAKTGLRTDYCKGVIRLLEAKEHRLLRAVEADQIPLSVAVRIAETDDSGIQHVLQEAYETKALRGRKLIQAKRLVERRRRVGKGRIVADSRRQLSVNEVLKTYRESADKKRLLVRKANATKGHLVFVTEALRKLVADERFVALLKAEDLATLPQPLAERLHAVAAD
jgi:ParB family transcriptional regulator, chromosome partitioning protein